ncbi:MAG: putative peptidoglycan glycosyltransferase FtsW, partial [Elusimicrobia bacterium]|nr:putative peptidoglycan glycosyltransferase FtsW [Elusimicrobiota bacterium]
MDRVVLAVTLFLLFFGFVMMYSASAHWAEENMGDALYFVKRQALWLVVGLACMFGASKISYKRWGEWAWPLLVLTALALGATFAFHPVAGVRRWIRFGHIGVQPAEFAKLTMVIFLADYLDRKRSKAGTFVYGALVPWAVVGTLLGLIFFGRDLGTPALMFAVAVGLLFIGGARVSYVFGAVLAALPLLAYEAWREPYRRRRLLSFMDPFAQSQGAGYQLSQAIMAVASGGWFGKGLGASQLKLLHLPTPHTDFIFPVVCEELGLAESLVVLGLFATLGMRGIKIARGAPDLFGTLLAAG